MRSHHKGLHAPFKRVLHGRTRRCTTMIWYYGDTNGLKGSNWGGYEAASMYPLYVGDIFFMGAVFPTRKYWDGNTGAWATDGFAGTGPRTALQLGDIVDLGWVPPAYDEVRINWHRMTIESMHGKIMYVSTPDTNASKDQFPPMLAVFKSDPYDGVYFEVPRNNVVTGGIVVPNPPIASLPGTFEFAVDTPGVRVYKSFPDTLSLGYKPTHLVPKLDQEAFQLGAPHSGTASLEVYTAATDAYRVASPGWVPRGRINYISLRGHTIVFATQGSYKFDTDYQVSGIDKHSFPCKVTYETSWSARLHHLPDMYNSTLNPPRPKLAYSAPDTPSPLPADDGALTPAPGLLHTPPISTLDTEIDNPLLVAGFAGSADYPANTVEPVYTSTTAP